jgi:UDP-N-acetylglucosamine 1-carboxyvinyltransferase
MAKFQITGPTTLNGTVQVGGSKNAVLAILPGTLLATKPVTLTRVPAIEDVKTMLEILRHFGMKVEGESGTVTLDPTDLSYSRVPDELARRLRASITLLGPALARFGEYESVHPGGDVIGKRPLDAHFTALESLGATVERDDRRYHVRATELAATTVLLPEASVTATETLLMAATKASGTTVIKNAASELHVRDLAHFLTTLGAKITGAGTNKITVEGGTPLTGGDHRVRADEVEAATFIIAAAVTGGNVTIEDVDTEHFGVIPAKLQEAGINLEVNQTNFVVKGPHRLRACPLTTGLWPNFPSDVASPYAVLMTQAEGVSIVHEWMYEGRLFFTDKLVGMGANITMADPHRVIIFGPTPLKAGEVASPDIRAGISMVVAALIAEGTTTIDHIEHIDRGYEKLDERLQALGATITRIA